MKIEPLKLKEKFNFKKNPEKKIKRFSLSNNYNKINSQKSKILERPITLEINNQENENNINIIKKIDCVIESEKEEQKQKQKESDIDKITYFKDKDKNKKKEDEDNNKEEEEENNEKSKNFNKVDYLNSLKRFKELCGPQISKLEKEKSNTFILNAYSNYNTNSNKNTNDNNNFNSIKNNNDRFNNLSNTNDKENENNTHNNKIYDDLPPPILSQLEDDEKEDYELEEYQSFTENYNNYNNFNINTDIKTKVKNDIEDKESNINSNSNSKGIKFYTKISSEIFKSKKKGNLSSKIIKNNNNKDNKDKDNENNIDNNENLYNDSNEVSLDYHKKIEEDFIEADSEIIIEEDIFKRKEFDYAKANAIKEQKIKDKYINKDKNYQNLSNIGNGNLNGNENEYDDYNDEEIDIIYRHKKDYSLANYQLELLNWMHKRGNVKGTGKGGIISLPMGSGKTFSTLCKVMRDFQESNRPSLIVVPKSILSVWIEEIDKFFPENECPYLIYNKNQLIIHRKFTIDILKKVKIVLTTYPFILASGKKLNLLEEVVKRGPKGKIVEIQGKRIPRKEPNYSKLDGYNLLFNFVFENIICDESHKFSNISNKTFFALLNLFSKKRWCLTGNLIMNHENDLNSQLIFIGVNTVDIENSDKMRYVFYKNGINSLIDLPDKNIHKEILPLSHIEQEFYNYYKKSYKNAFENNYGIFEDISCIFVVILRFRQLCIHPFLLEKGKDQKKKDQGKLDFEKLQDDIEDNIPKDVKKWLLEDLNKKTSSTKVIRAVEIIKDLPKDEKIIIFSFFTDSFNQIEEYMKLINLKDIKTAKIEGKDKDFDREITIERFRNDPEIKVLFLTYTIGSCGLNLFCANNIIMMDLWWNFAVFDQSIARIYRNGQSRSVNIYVLMIKDSIDLYLWELIEHKRDIFKSLTTNTAIEKDKSKTRQLFEDILYNDENQIKIRKQKLGEEYYSD